MTGLASSARALLHLWWARTMTPMVVVAIAALVMLPMVFGALYSSLYSVRAGPDADPAMFLVARFDQLVLPLATPIIALLLGTSAFSAEAEDGTLLYLVTTTTRRWWICATRVLFASIITALLSAIAVVGTGLLVNGTEDPMRVTRAFAIAAAFGGATYAALFTALSLLVRRALVTGLAYVIFWEGVLSTTFPAIHYLSVRQWMIAIAGSITDASTPRLDSGPSVTAAMIGGALVFLLAAVLGARALDRPRLSRMGT